MSPLLTRNKQLLNKHIQKLSTHLQDCWEERNLMSPVNQTKDENFLTAYADLCEWNLPRAPPTCHYRRIWHTLFVLLYYTAIFSTPVNIFSPFVISNTLTKFIPFSSLQFDWYYESWTLSGKMIPSTKEGMHIQSTKNPTKTWHSL